jgi:hypothetical protein
VPFTWVTMKSTSCCETSGDRLNFCDTIWAISFFTALRETCRRYGDADWIRRLWIVPEPIKIPGDKSTSRAVRRNGTKVGWPAKIGQKVAILRVVVYGVIDL